MCSGQQSARYVLSSFFAVFGHASDGEGRRGGTRTLDVRCSDAVDPRIVHSLEENGVWGRWWREGVHDNAIYIEHARDHEADIIEIVIWGWHVDCADLCIWDVIVLQVTCEYVALN